MSKLEQHFLEDLSVGQTASFSKAVTDQMVRQFAEISGDTNSIHLDDDYAATTMFKKRIAHGILVTGFISKVIGTQLPGLGTIYMSQSLKFKAPVYLGDEVTATVTVKEIIAEKKRVILETTASVGDKVVIEGEAMIMVPSRADG